MKTYPYTTPDGIIELVRKDEHDAVVAELLERLRERTESHLAASARDVATIQRQAVEISKWQALAEMLATPLKAVIVETEAGNILFHNLYEHNAEAGHAALAAYDAAKKGDNL